MNPVYIRTPEYQVGRLPTEFVKVSEYRVALAHIIEWEYTEAYQPPAGEIDIDTGEQARPRRSRICVTTMEQCANELSHYDGDVYGIGVQHVKRAAFGEEADILRDLLNRMVIS